MRQRHHLQLVYSASEQTMSASQDAATERVYPPHMTCWNCRALFMGESVRQVVENDGVCDACAEQVDAFPYRSNQRDEARGES